MCEKFRVTKTFMPKRGTSRFSIEMLLSHNAEEFRRRTILYFRKILVSKQIGRRGGQESRLNGQNCFVSECPENF